ncbi:hypothetical protein BGZ76_010367 [Entomortierella beljakovae]|nr:hypothetical protein BGZ76_010367 [Entomortierella beljakovae]
MSTSLMSTASSTSSTSPNITTHSPPLTPPNSSESSNMTRSNTTTNTTTKTSAMSPQQFNVLNHPIKDTLTIVSNLLSILIHKNDAHYDPLRDPVTLFHSRAVPRISIEAYLTRILQYIPFTNEVLLNVLVYLDRIGGLEGMQLQKGGTLMSDTTTSSSSSVPATVTTTTEIFNSAVSSSNNNLDNNVPMIQKRGHDQVEQDKETDALSKKIKMSDTINASTTSTTSTTTDESKASVVTPATPISTPLVPSQPISSGNGFRVNSFNIHRLLITCLMIAAKFTSDLFYSNSRYAKVGGLSLQELNQLELEFLFTTKFELNVKVDELQRVGDALLQFRNLHMIKSVQQQQKQQQHQHQMLQQLQFQQQQQLQNHIVQMQLQLQKHQQQQRSQHMPYNTIPSPTSPNPIPSTAMMTPSVPSQQIRSPVGGKKVVTSQKTQLLSPPEEKRPWVESDVHDAHTQRIDVPSQY